MSRLSFTTYCGLLVLAPVICAGANDTEWTKRKFENRSLPESVLNQEDHFAGRERRSELLMKEIKLRSTALSSRRCPANRTNRGRPLRPTGRFTMGTDGNQTGYSPDAGPSKGKIAWRVAKGNFWYATPVIENGKVYTAAPGAGVV